MARVKIKIKSNSLADAKAALEGGNARVSRPAFNSPKSTYRKGSEGSRVETDNKNEQVDKENNVVAQAPAMTDMPYSALPIIDNRVDKDSPEMIRRMNNHSRDRRTGNKVTDDTIYART